MKIYHIIDTNRYQLFQFGEHSPYLLWWYLTVRTSLRLLLLNALTTLKNQKLLILKLSHRVFPTSIIKSFHLLIYSLFHMKITASVTKSSHQYRGPFCLHVPIFYLYSLLFCRKKSHDCCFSQKIVPQTTIQWHILQYYYAS